jgi:serine/threonine-protein kinase PknG
VAGAGLVEVPPVAVVDPAAAVMAVPEVAEAARFCAFCGGEVGRGGGRRPGPVAGFCGRCRLPYSFAPSLSRGDLVAGQYRIVGCLAYGGLGWIYLAQDEQVSRRWVVLKGMLNTKDPEAMAAALAERQFLARVEHPNVVRIYNFVQHAGAGYIVMEYVGGRTLQEVLEERRRAGLGALPVELAIAYVLGILPAFRYLHGLGLLYNDLKPDNVMLQGEDVKLVDLGAVSRIDDDDPMVFGAEGYQAPEVAARGPSVASDLYSVARCLAALLADGPPAAHDSLLRFLAKGMAAEPEARFQGADEMAEQLLGVLREVVAVKSGTPAPAASALFGGDLQPFGAAAGEPVGRPEWRHLPPVAIDQADPAAGFVLHAVLLRDAAQQLAMLREAVRHGRLPDTAEVELGLARALIDLGEFGEADACLARVAEIAGRDWRVVWYRGVSLLAQRRPADACEAFDRVCSELPGELAPRLALGLAAELAGDLQAAARLYEVVVATDPGFTSACFGLGRAREALGDRAGAVEAYAAIAPTSSLHVEARLAAARALLSRAHAPPSVDELARASGTIERLALDAGTRGELCVLLLETALELLEAGSLQARHDLRVLGQPVAPAPLRLALERAYRGLASLASGREKIRLVDLANGVRPTSRR